MLSTYGNFLQAEVRVPLRTLSVFSKRYMGPCFSAIHLLPFYPFASDYRFSVIAYLAVNPTLSSWDDFNGLDQDFDLMCDFVLNHISGQSAWYAIYLAERPGFFTTPSGALKHAR